MNKLIFFKYNWLVYREKIEDLRFLIEEELRVGLRNLNKLNIYFIQGIRKKLQEKLKFDWFKKHDQKYQIFRLKILFIFLAK